jgi:hypothetical protein
MLHGFSHVWNIDLRQIQQYYNVVEILSDEKASDTWRSGELRFYFKPAGSDVYCVQASEEKDSQSI